MFIFVCTVILLLFIAYIAIKLKEEDREKEARYTFLRQERAENLNREDELFSRILEEENVPKFYLKIGLLGGYRCPPTHIPSDEITPALLWKVGAQFFLLPIGPGYLRMQLNGKEATQITVWCKDYWDKTGLIPPTEVIEYYRGPFAKYFRETAQRRKVDMDRNHPEFIKRFIVPNETITSLRRSGEYRKMEDYYKKMQRAGCKPKPILHYYGEYSFGGYYISKPSAKLIHEKYGVRFVAEESSMPINDWTLGHPRISKEEIDVYKALLNDGLITQEEYEKRKEKYLRMSFRHTQKGDSFRLHELTKYLQLDLITRSEANYWLEYGSDSNVSKSPKAKQETKGENRQESPGKYAMRLVDEGRNLNDVASMTGLERWEVDALFDRKVHKERRQIERRRERVKRKKRLHGGKSAKKAY